MSELKRLSPKEIEAMSFRLLEAELQTDLDPREAPVIKRCIHTSADFDYERSLYFSDGVIDRALEIFKKGATIVTDTAMALAGINKPALAKLGLAATCFIADEDVARLAQEQKITRASVAIDKAAQLPGNLVFVIGNAPTALIRLCELIRSAEFKPALIIGVPVGFVNVVESKEMIMRCAVPQIVNRGRKGGSNIAAAIVNALLYQALQDL